MSNIVYIANQESFGAVASLQASLESQGHGWVPMAWTGDELNQLKARQADLVLMDVEAASPGSVADTLRIWRRDPALESIPVVVCSHGQPLGELEMDQWHEVGVDHVLDFGAEADTALRNLQLILRLRHSLRQAENLAQQMTEMNSELYERNCQVEKELYVTRQLQQSLLPSEIKEEGQEQKPQPTEEELLMNPELAQQVFQKFSKCHFKNDKLRVTGIYLPCDALGGDLYDIIPFKDETLGVAVADVSGHGVPAGFITAIFKASLYRTTLTYSNPSDILFHLNNELANIVTTGDYVTGVYCRISEDYSKMEYSGAGHPYPMFYRAATNSLERLTENGTPLVWIPDMDYPVGEIDLAPGDKVFIFTDGISEMVNAEEQILGEEALEAIYLEAIAKGSDEQEILDQMLVTVSDFTEGTPLNDDLSLVLIERF